jgi:hypothetical protein
MSTSALRPHQLSLVELVGADTARSVVLCAPPGTGAQTALAAAAASFAREDRLVVVVTHLRILAQQWVERLTKEEVTPLHILLGGSDLRLALSRGSEAWPDRGVIIATDAALTTGSIARKIDLRPDLLIIDDAEAVPPAAVEGIERLSRASRRTVARVHETIPAWLPDADAISWDADTVVPDRRDRYTIDVVPYRVDAKERALIKDAVAFLEDVVGPLHSEAVTRYGIQSRLQRLESASGSDSPVESSVDENRIELQPAQQVRLAELLDQFDDLGEDPRLEVLASIVMRARNDRRPCVVVVESLRELAYVVSYLHEAVPTDVKELTSRLLPEEAVLVRKSLSAGVTVVASAGFIESGQELPSGTVNVWWSPPRTRTAAEARLGVGFNTAGINVYALVPDPPLTDGPPAVLALIETLVRRESR